MTLFHDASQNVVSFERLLSAYERPIFSFIFRLVGRRETAEDLTQETFIKVYKNLHKIDTSQSVRAWIYKIATRTVYDWLRRERTHREILIIDDPDSGFETIDDSNTYNEIEASADIASALEKLKPMHRAVLLLYFQKELGYAEIAQSLKIPINTVKTHLSRAKKALRDALQNYGSA